MSDDLETVERDNSGSQAGAEIPALDGPVGAYMRWAETQQPNRLYALAVVSTIACHELARYGFHLRHNRYPMSVWFALAGESASGKTTAIRQGRTFIEKVWEESSVTHPTPPWIEAEGSIAGLLAVLHDLYDVHRRTTTAILFHHELSSVFQTREPVGEMLCRLADGLTYERNLRELQSRGGSRGRGGRGQSRPDQIINPVVSGVFASTEVALARVFNEAHRQGGLYSRICWLYPRFTRDDARFEPDGPPGEDPLWREAVDAWTGWIAMLSTLENREISLSPEAESALRGFFDRQRNALQEHDPMNGPRMRLVEKARVFSALFAVGRLTTTVSAEDMERACAIADVLIEHAEALSHLGSDPIVRKINKAREIIDMAGDLGISFRTLYKRLGVSKSTAEEVVGTLINAAYIVDVKPRGASSPANTLLVSTTCERGRRLLQHSRII